MSGRFTQSRAETQRHQQILRDELKRPENKLCADCKRNDPRWASTNLGVFVCIRCSGIHRSLGVHISRIKSIDLDTWTPEQVANVQRWGNKRANVYWEKHLKPGHVPPDHKIESFIRSKYESRRWAMDGPLPDPETLDGDSNDLPASTETATPSQRSSSASASGPRKAAATTSIDLLSAPPSSTARPSSSSSARSTPAPPKPAQDSLFDLDFDAAPSAPSTAPAASPAPQQQQQPKRDPKADILSLFNAAPPPQPARPVAAQPQHAQQPSFGGGAGGLGGVTTGLAGLSFGAQPPPSRATGGGADPAGWGAPPSHPVQHSAGLASSSSFGDFGGFSAAPSIATPSHAEPHDPWASSSTTTASSNSIWGNASSTPAAATSSAPKANDPFAEFGSFSNPAVGGGSDIWASSGSGVAAKSAGSGAGGFSDIWA